MEEKNRGFRGAGGSEGEAQQGNRARKATMVFGGDQARRLRQQVDPVDGGAEERVSEADQFMPGVVEVDEAFGGEDMARGVDDTKQEATRQAEVGDDSFQSYDDIFDIPAEPTPVIASTVTAETDPFDIPFEESAEVLSAPEPPKGASISVGKIVRPSSQIAPPPQSQTPPEVPPMHEVQIPVAEPQASQPTAQGTIMTNAHEQIFWKTDAPLVGFLVSYDHNPRGAYVELRAGRLMVSNQREASGSCLVIPHASISPMHAIMRVAAGGVLQVLDQLSESGTRVVHAGSEGEEFLSGEKANLGHGDVIYFGERKFHVCLVMVDGEG